MSIGTRAMWEAVERYHQLCDWAPEVREEAEKVGLKGFFMNYFATRVAPLGALSAEAVRSLAFYYSPRRVQRAIPDAWEYASPEEVLRARYLAMDGALTRELGEAAGSEHVAEAVQLVRHVVDGADGMGRALYAGWKGLSWPKEPHLALWHGCTLLREHRSGSHLIALAMEGLNGCEAVVSQVAVGEAPHEWIRGEAGWDASEHEEAVRTLRLRGWLDSRGLATDACSEGRHRIEQTTDGLEELHWGRLGDKQCQRLLSIMADLNVILPKDDQLDWKEVYDSHNEQK